MPRDKRALPAAPSKDAERVAKVIARAGLGSRREIEDWIAEGRVAVNGTVLESPAFTVTAADAITVDGAPLPERERTRLFLYHKPAGVVTTNRDPEGRTTLFEILPQGLPRLVSIGRLDLNSEGLLLLTNDGGLARVLELPETGWLRRYRVRANGTVDQAQLDALIKGITVDGIEYGPIEATLDRAQGANVWLTVALREGKNREVRNVLGALGLKVGRLIRVSYGPFQLGEIAEGGIEEVKTRILRDQIGAEIAAAAGADFSGPLVEREIEEAPVRPLRPAGKRQVKREQEIDAARRAGRARQEQAFEDAPAPRGRDRRRREERELESLGTVADRKGRAVKVERVVKTEAPARPARAGKSEGPRRGRPAGKDGGRDFERPAGRFGDKPRRAGPSRFAREEGAGEQRREGPRGRSFRSDDREARPDFRKGGTRSGERAERPSRSFADRPQRARRDDFDGERPQRSYQDRPPRARREDAGTERPPRGPRAGEGDHRIGRGPGRPRRDDFTGERAERASRPPRPRGDEQRGGERPQRSFQDRPPRARRDDGAGERPPRGERPSYGERPPRREGAAGTGPRGQGRGFGERGDGREDGRPPRRGGGAGFRSEGGGSERPRSEGFGGERPRGAGPKGPGSKGAGPKGFGGKGPAKGGRPAGGPKGGRPGPRGKR
ncbi:pseudouridine synthase [Xanthobacter pseudotagetidis]|uniref:pseudouridine synthase n=1 Tax=Xanthobacter pseudotagetidis TaxID=3119911 RepID=UPI00372D000B